ncbi:myosin-like coiled-coil protein-domain-containing protein [Exophiala viscosa]|uniref:myosin-like coiled-coil protein-domain-containing protein n=1 Tax=Exophiala viscosa TaxID=2486360 RepID=UPI00218E4904|nr:myosin-like coiled-coil protein-domain-containing protein [Exophiala viscosa]
MATTAQSPISQTTSITNGDMQDLPPPAPAAKKSKAKKDKQLSAEENAKLVQARLSQLEQEKAGEKNQQAEVDREVKKATRDLNELINSVEGPMSRLDLVQRKYEELLGEMKKLERDYAKNKKRADQLQKEQDKSKSEHNKTATMKDKLEKLCRELTKENKKLKDENKKLEETEKQARETINERLDQMLYDVQEVMNSKTTTHSENLHLELDELFKTRCKVLADQAEIRETHFKAILRHKDAEIAHLQARHEVERRRADAEAGRCRTLTNQVSTFSHTEAELRGQLNIYVEKFKQVEDTLNNSNELFLTFRKEMEEMSKKTKRLEKENLNLTRKHDQTNRNILEMAEERTRDKEDLERLRKQEQQMRNIIKTMQEQGRGGPIQQEMVDEEGTESEYDEEYEDEDEEEEEEEDDDVSYEGEEELAAEISKPVFGPVPPPEMVANKTNGQKTPGLANGIRH